MGRYDSSQTRVAPLFDALLTRDDTGLSWLDALRDLGSRPAVVAILPVGQRPVSQHGSRWRTCQA
jgi:hypothetical protein